MQTTANNMNAGSTNADAAAVTVTNSDWGNAAANRFTAASGTPFSGVSVNDWASIYLDGSTTTTYVAQVTAVNAGGASIDLSATVRIGAAPSTGATGRSCKVGGAFADMAVVTSLFNTVTAAVPTRVNIKAGTYANTTTNRAFLLVGTATAPVWWRGYKTTIGDQDTNNVAVAGTDIPAITFTTGQMSCQSYNIFSNLDITSQCISGNGAFASGVKHTLLYRCRITNTATNANSRAFTATQDSFVMIACYLKATTTADCVLRLDGFNIPFVLGCTITGGAKGVTCTVNGALIISCVIDSPAGDAINASGGSTQVVGCSIYAPTGHGVNITSTALNAHTLVANCYFENVNQASKAAIANTSGTNSDQIICVGNAYYNCTATTSGLTENFTVLDNGTLASAAFTTPGSQDFSIGTVAKALGIPGLFENVSAYRGYLDVGAVQRQEPAGGGSTYVINQIRNMFLFNETEP